MIKDYDCTIEYHPKKANMVANALSRKSSKTSSSLAAFYPTPLEELKLFNLELAVNNVGALLTNLRIRPLLYNRIRGAQYRDSYLLKVREGL